jgi:RNA-binding protein YlmH
MTINKKDKELVLRKILDKANNAYEKNYIITTDFLDLYEQSLFLNNIKQLPPIKYCITGGFSESERKIIVFYPEYINEEELVLPINIIKISPVNNNFAKKLTHRDFLGSIINSGLKRSKIGDIIVNANEGYVFCIDTIAQFITDNIFMIKNTNVSAEIIDALPENAVELNYTIIKQTVSSIRLDNIVKVALSISRTKAADLISNSKVFINSCLNNSTSCKLNEGDIISVRGYGKFKLFGIGNTTKKGRIYIELHKYT